MVHSSKTGSSGEVELETLLWHFANNLPESSIAGYSIIGCLDICLGATLLLPDPMLSTGPWVGLMPSSQPFLQSNCVSTIIGYFQYDLDFIQSIGVSLLNLRVQLI